MPFDSDNTVEKLASESVLADAFEALRPRLQAMIRRRLNLKLAARVDAEGLVNEAYVRARRRWLDASKKPADHVAWIYRQVRDSVIEAERQALGPTRDVAREVPWPDESTAQLAAKLFDSMNRPSAGISMEERRGIVQAALQKLDPIDREILALRFFDDLDWKAIAEILDLEHENTVARRGSRALLKLRRHIPRDFRPPGASSI